MEEQRWASSIRAASGSRSSATKPSSPPHGREFASWSLSAIEGASWAVLLQDRPQSNRFVSFGPWDSLEAMAAWRANPGFAERVAEIRPLIERLAPSTLEAVAEVGTGPKSG